MASPETDELTTEPFPAAELPEEPEERAEPESVEPARPAKQRGRWWRGVTGSLAAGLAVLAVGVAAVEVVCLITGVPGPGALLLVGHPVAAIIALLAQRVADRRNGRPAGLAGLVVLLVTVAALALFWLT